MKVFIYVEFFNYTYVYVYMFMCRYMYMSGGMCTWVWVPVEANGIRCETIATSSCETLDTSGGNRAIAISLSTAEP